jgi:hypothetical protein
VNRTGITFQPARLAALLLLLLATSFTGFAENGKVESIGAFVDAGASDSMKKALEPKGYRVSLGDGTVLCEVWLASAIASGKNSLEGATYTWISESALIGVIRFPKTSNDFRKQQLKAGSYTLRYAVHPQDGNHLGISPIRDFLLLTPVADDPDPNMKFKFEDLATLSKKASGTNHPSPMSLVTTEGISTWPSVLENENGHLVLAAKTKNSTGAEVSLAFVVKGVAEQ